MPLVRLGLLERLCDHGDQIDPHLSVADVDVRLMRELAPHQIHPTGAGLPDQLGEPPFVTESSGKVSTAVAERRCTMRNSWRAASNGCPLSLEVTGWCDSSRSLSRRASGRLTPAGWLPMPASRRVGK